MVITDGMCSAAIRFARDMLVGRDKNLELDKFPIIGRMIGYPQNGPVNDSAAAATALSCGGVVPLYKIGREVNGKPIPSLFQVAQKKGFRVGLVSDTRLTHATPAPFATNVANRDDETRIAQQMVKSGFHVLLSGGKRYFQNKDQGGKQPSGTNLLEQAAQEGFTVLQTADDLSKAVVGKADRVLGLFSDTFLPFPWETNYSPDFSLEALTRSALALLEKGGKGFLLMVEAGKMDVANHNHDAVSLLQSMEQLEGALKVLTEYVKKHPDTLIVVVSDHATGGFKITEAFDEERFRKLATSTFGLAFSLKDRPKESGKVLRKLFPDMRFSADNLAALYKPQDFADLRLQLGNIISEKLGLVFFSPRLQKTMDATHGHTSEDLFIHAMGHHQELFQGAMRIWEVPQRLGLALDIAYPPN
jgi:alkaline phosphatase